MGKVAEKIGILLVEDNPADIRLIEEAFRDERITPNTMTVCRDGADAIAYLQSVRDEPASSWPGLVLLDLNIPKLSGREVLAFIKQDDKLQTIPVLIMTSSRDDTEIRKAYAARANSFIGKPLNYNDLIEVVSAIDQFWLSTVVLPKRPPQ